MSTVSRLEFIELRVSGPGISIRDGENSICNFQPAPYAGACGPDLTHLGAGLVGRAASSFRATRAFLTTRACHRPGHAAHRQYFGRIHERHALPALPRQFETRKEHR